MQDFIEKNHRSNFGDVIIAPHFLSVLLLYALLLFLFVLSVYVFRRIYTKKKCQWDCLPDKGIISIKSKQSGTLSALYKKVEILLTQAKNCSQSTHHHNPLLQK